MQFLKKHYEKILLTVVLVSLLGAAGYLFFEVQSVKVEMKKMRDIPQAGGGGKAKAIKADEYKNLIERVRKPSPSDLGQGNLVFNPYTWKMNPTNPGVIFLAKEVGPGRLNIKAITPLNLVVDGVVTSTGGNVGYDIGITKDFDKNPLLRKRTRRAATLNQWTVFDKGVLEVMLKEVKVEGDAVYFTMDLKFMADTLTNITFTKAAPYKKVISYSVDLEYPRANVTYPPGRREGDEILIDGEPHILIYIQDKAVTVEAKSNKKRTVIPLKR